VKRIRLFSKGVLFSRKKKKSLMGGGALNKRNTSGGNKKIFQTFCGSWKQFIKMGKKEK